MKSFDSKVWQPIEDLPNDFEALSDGELSPLLQVWEDLRAELMESGGLDQFNSELEREWAIETGQIEGIYDIERGVTRTLIERGISADLIPHASGRIYPELIAAILRDHTDVLEGLFQFVKNERTLSKSYINQVHAALLQHQTTATVVDQFGNVFEIELLKGQYKKLPNNPTKPDGTKHLYCPPEHVEAEMDRLIAIHSTHVLAGVPVDIQAAWLHHRFTQVHPYQDGNGRVARALASLLFIKTGWFPVVVTRDDRVRYLDALEAADAGDLLSLVACFVDIQKRSLFQATKVAADALPASTVDEAILSVKRLMAGLTHALEPAIWTTSRKTADRLMDLATLRFEEVQQALEREVKSAKPEFSVSGGADPIGLPLEIGFAANRKTYDRVFSLSLRTDRSEDSREITVRAFGIGTKFRGLIGISVYFSSPTATAEVFSGDLFQINYAESVLKAERRFRPWLEKSLIQALALWRRSL